jgi:hypothetical protein
MMPLALEREGLNDTYWYGVPSPPSWMPGASMNKALTKLNQTKVELGVGLAEFASTLRMLTHPMSSLAKLSTQFFKKRKKRLPKRRKPTPRELVDATTNTWLETRYGWLPTMSDATEIINLSIVGLRRAALHELRTKKAGVSYSTHAKKTIDSRGSFFRGKVTKLTETDFGVYTTLGFHFTGTNAVDMYLAQLGLGLYDIPSIVYETVPFSFVLDWVFDVGTYLSAIRPKPYLKIDNAGQSIRTSVRETYTIAELCSRRYCSSTTSWDPEPNWNFPGTLTRTSNGYTRYSTSPQACLPRVNLSLPNITRVVDGLTLLWQQLPRR